MQRLCFLLTLWLATASLACGQVPPPAPTPPIPAPAPAEPVHWPAVPTPVTPAPTPGAVQTLAADEIYVIGLDADATVLASPAGIVTVSTEPGPVKMKGRFVGGTGVQWKTFKNQQVVSVDPIGTGRVEIMVVWGGVGGASKVERRFLDVGGSTPPAPVPPTPPAPADTFASAVQTAFTAEADPEKADQVKQLASVFRLAAGVVKKDTTLATTADVLSRVSASRSAVLADTDLPKIRPVIGAELNKTLGGTPAALDATKRAEVSATLARAASALEGVK
jgi:hypothetical protein